MRTQPMNASLLEVLQWRRTRSHETETPIITDSKENSFTNRLRCKYTMVGLFRHSPALLFLPATKTVRTTRPCGLLEVAKCHVRQVF